MNEPPKPRANHRQLLEAMQVGDCISGNLSLRQSAYAYFGKNNGSVRAKKEGENFYRIWRVK